MGGSIGLGLWDASLRMGPHLAWTLITLANGAMEWLWLAVAVICRPLAGRNVRTKVRTYQAQPRVDGGRAGRWPAGACGPRSAPTGPWRIRPRLSMPAVERLQLAHQ
ncbi:hypothetical protein G6F68_019415 [Rhizopus microsporus]|nr:hypothetical protein G6F68_019415 [Rhizopus microsporus]